MRQFPQICYSTAPDFPAPIHINNYLWEEANCLFGRHFGEHSGLWGLGGDYDCHKRQFAKLQTVVCQRR